MDRRRWYRLFSKKRFAEEQTSGVMVQEMLGEVAASEPFVVGIDGFPVARCSATLPGAGWMRGLRTAKFKPGIQCCQRFVEGAQRAPRLPPIVNGYSRAIPIRCLNAFTAKAAASADAARTEGQAGLAFGAWTRKQMDEAGRQAQLLLSAVCARGFA